MEIDMTDRFDERKPQDQVANWAWLSSGLGTAADRRNQLVLMAWALVWLVGITLATQALKGNLSQFGIVLNGGAAWAVAVLPNVLAVGVLLAFLRFLLQALAAGFGAWFFFAMGWPLFQVSGAPPMGNDTPLLVPVFGYLLGTSYFAWRYR
jgi:hypothetical protein